MKKDYYVPATLKHMVKTVNELLKDPELGLSGEELVTGVRFVDEEDDEFPPNTIIFEIQEPTDKDPNKGILYIGPQKPKILM